MKLSYLLLFVVALFPIIAYASEPTTPPTYEELFSMSNNVFEGEVIDFEDIDCEAKSVDFRRGTTFGTELKMFCSRVYDVKVIKILKGDLKVGDNITLYSSASFTKDYMGTGSSCGNVNVAAGEMYTFLPSSKNDISICTGKYRVYEIADTQDKKIMIFQKIRNWIREMFEYL